MRFAVLVTVLAICSPYCIADYIQTDRYTLVEPKPKLSEIDPLSVNVQISFPPHIKTVGDAVGYVLLNSGWVLAIDSASDSALAITLNRPLPQVHKKLTLMPLRRVLQVLVGVHYTPVEDPIRRIYSFDLKDGYRGLVKHD